MFTVKLKDGTLIQATSVEESCRPEHDGTAHVSLTVQNGDAQAASDLDALKEKLTADALGSIQVFTEGDAVSPVKIFEGYRYIRYLTARLQPDGTTLLDMNFSKDNLAV